jgi:hypothetical protein
MVKATIVERKSKPPTSLSRLPVALPGHFHRGFTSTALSPDSARSLRLPCCQLVATVSAVRLSTALFIGVESECAGRRISWFRREMGESPASEGANTVVCCPRADASTAAPSLPTGGLGARPG